MKEIIRRYQDSDYAQCEELVNQAWGFDQIFKSETLIKLAKTVYTKGSVLSSNYRMVIEVDGEVVGFIFGLNANGKKTGKNVLFLLSIMWRFSRIEKEEVDEKNTLLAAMRMHDVHRSRVVNRGGSEVVLFVIDKKFQKQGFGSTLWSGFKAEVEVSGVSSVIVETNKVGASGFYEALGFSHLGDFDSPLHELATKNGQACIYKFSITPDSPT